MNITLETWEQAKNKLIETAYSDILASAGISIETAINTGIGIIDDKIIIPIAPYSGIFAEYDPTSDTEIIHGEPTAYNSDSSDRRKNKDRIVYITDRTIDAVAIQEITGDRAVALNGDLENALTGLKGNKYPVYIAGNDNNKSLSEMGAFVNTYTDLKNAGELNAELNLSLTENSDTSIAALLRDKKSHFADTLKREIRGATAPATLDKYINTTFERDLKDRRRYTQIRTGFNELDAKLNGIYPGLYTIAAIPSIGKTAFCLQLAEQLAQHGNHVLYISVEMATLELAVRCIARYTKAHTDTPRTIGDIYRYDPDSLLNGQGIATQYAETVKTLSIEQGDFCTTTDDIRGYIQDYIDRTGEQPIVFVDYLQLIRPGDPGDGKRYTGSRREEIDNIVSDLKILSREKGTPIFVISALARSNYYSEIGLDSLKESGGIEYTADVVIGLQLAATSDLDTTTDEHGRPLTIGTKRQKIQNALSEDPRRVQLVILKNRYGRIGDKIKYNYSPKYDYFEEDNEELKTDMI